MSGCSTAAGSPGRQLTRCWACTLCWHTYAWLAGNVWVIGIAEPKELWPRMTAATAVLGCHRCVANGALHWRRQKCSFAAAGYNTRCVRVCCDGRSSAAQVGEACSSGRLTDMDCRFLRAFPSLTPAKRQTQDTCWQLAGNVVDTGRAFASRHLLSVLRNSVQQHTQ